MKKPLFGVVHLAPLPSAARSDRPDLEGVLAAALADGRALAEGGVDGIVVENFGDAPFHKGSGGDPVPPDVPAAMAVVAWELRRELGLPLCINVLRNDGYAALGVAAAVGAVWVRVNVFSGAYVTDQGLVEGEAARLCAFRKRLGTETGILADFLVKHSVPLTPMEPIDAALDLAERSGASGLILSGERTGSPVDRALLDEIVDAVPGFPVWIGSGLTVDNAEELWPPCHGAIVGSSLKRGGRIDEPVDPQRVRALRRVLDQMGSGGRPA